MEDVPGRLFLDFSAKKLDQLCERIGKCLEKLNYDQVWARPGADGNAIGNLVLHLRGNVRQWIGTGVAGRSDARRREVEFATRGGLQPVELRERLVETVHEVVAVLRELPLNRLTDKVTIQAYEVTVLEAIYHVVEHFAQHTGQILFATKQLTSEDLGFYRHLGGPEPHGEKMP